MSCLISKYSSQYLDTLPLNLHQKWFVKTELSHNPPPPSKTEQLNVYKELNGDFLVTITLCATNIVTSQEHKP